MNTTHKMADLYANENFPIPVVEQLRKFGHDVLTTHEAGKSRLELPDEEVLNFAIERRRVVVTFNRRDFVRLHKKNPAHAGIVVCSQHPNVTSLAERIDRKVRANEPLNGKLIRVNLIENE